MESFRLRIINRFGKPTLSAFVDFGDGTANLFPSESIQRPFHQTGFHAFQLRDRSFLPTREGRGKTLSLQQQQFLSAGEKFVFRIFRRLIAQLNECLQSHLRIAQVGHQSSDLADATIFARPAIFSDLADRQPHGGAQFLEMLAHFVHGDAALFGWVLAQVKSRLDLFPENPFQSIRQRFA
jgi:hypothetical protein